MHNVLISSPTATYFARSSVLLLPLLFLLPDVKALPVEDELGLLGHAEYPEYDSRELSADESYEELYPELPGKRAWASNFSGGMGKRAWNSQFSGGIDASTFYHLLPWLISSRDAKPGRNRKPKRGWQDISRGQWGKRSWQELSRGNWGKRSWQDLSRGNWGKRSWQELSRGNWGKRNWQNLRGNWGKRALRLFNRGRLEDRLWNDLTRNNWGKRSWQELSRGNWGKRSWQDLSRGNWGKRVPDEISFNDGDISNLEERELFDDNDYSPNPQDFVNFDNVDLKDNKQAKYEYIRNAEEPNINENNLQQERQNMMNQMDFPIKQANKVMSNPETGMQAYQADDGSLIVTYDNYNSDQDETDKDLTMKLLINHGSHSDKSPKPTKLEKPEDPKPDKNGQPVRSPRSIKDLLASNSWNKRATTWMQLRDF